MFLRICNKFENSTEQVPNTDLPRKPQPTNSCPASPGEKGDDENNDFSRNKDLSFFLFQHGISVPASSVVLLNALGYIGFKVVTTCGDSQV